MHIIQLIPIAAILLVTGLFTSCANLTSDIKKSEGDVNAYLDGSSAKRSIEFSGFTWWVKESKNLAGPGPNWWSASKENVWVDKEGRLHMKITYRDGKWFCSEVVCEEPATYGTYVFYLSGRIDKLDPRVIFGLFTWDDTAYKTQANCEIDIEFSRWNDPLAPNLHYSLQPARGPDDPSGRYKERIHMSNMTLEKPQSTHSFTWTPKRVVFSSFEGYEHPAHQLDGWSYVPAHPRRRARQGTMTSDPVGIPQPGPDTHLRINLWLLDADGDSKADPPMDGEEVEVIIERFSNLVN